MIKNLLKSIFNLNPHDLVNHYVKKTLNRTNQSFLYQNYKVFYHQPVEIEHFNLTSIQYKKCLSKDLQKEKCQKIKI